MDDDANNNNNNVDNTDNESILSTKSNNNNDVDVLGLSQQSEWSNVSYEDEIQALSQYDNYDPDQLFENKLINTNNSNKSNNNLSNSNNNNFNDSDEDCVIIGESFVNNSRSASPAISV